MYVDVRDAERRRMLIDHLIKNGYKPDLNEKRGEDDIVSGTLPIRVDKNSGTFGMMGNVTCAAAAASSRCLMGPSEFLNRWRINSLKFEKSLWEKVKVVEEPDGTRRLSDSIFHDERKLFPYITVSGYNEENGCEEKYVLSCYELYEYTKKEWEEDYEISGDSPAFTYPDQVLGHIQWRIFVLEDQLRAADEDIEYAKKKDAMQEDKAKYYLIGTGLVGKREPESDTGDYLFIDDKWIPDDEGIIGKLLAGEDLTEQSFKSFDPCTVQLINSIEEMERMDAMENITDQTLTGLKAMWKEKFAKNKEEWDKDPKWWSKLVSTEFEMNGVRRTLYPSDLPFEPGPSYEGFMEYIRGEMNRDLREKGARIIANWGIQD